MGSFNWTKFPRRELLAELFPGQDVPDVDRPVLVRCVIPGCQHTHGQDRSPSMLLHPQRGRVKCLRNGGEYSGWKALVTALLGEGRWKRVVKLCMEDDPEQQAGEWERLEAETAWTRRYQISPELSRLYLRSGDRRAKGDPISATIIGAWSGGKLHGLKFRLPAGETWADGTDPKYMWRWKAKSADGLVLLADRACPGATIVFCAGEKDALVAASFLRAERWAPVTGVDGEATVPKGARAVCEGRDVVIAYDGDEAGRGGAHALAQALAGAARSVRAVAWPDEPPPAGEARWDVAGWVAAGRPLEPLLEAAIAVPPEWARVARSPASEAVACRATPTAAPGDPTVIDPLDSWREIGGRICAWRATRDGGHYEPRLHGTARVVRSEITWLEDDEQPSGWSAERRITYRLELPGQAPQEHVVPSGQGKLLELLDRVAGAAVACHTTTAKAQLYQYVQRTEAKAARVEVRRALGPHGELGWLAPPRVAVRGGRVEEASCTIAPPGDLQDLRRYRLAAITDEDLQRAGRFVVDKLLRCDHVGGAYVLPIVGAVLSAPLWHYVPLLASWQRYALFVQGPSGVGKSQLLRYLLSFWGDFRDPEGLTTWTSSATYVEDLLYQAKGVPVFVADWKRSNFSTEAMRSSMALLQAYADRSSRGRADARGRAQRRRPPRCTLLLDGEDLPEGQQSTIGRLVVVEVQAHGDTLRCATANDDTLSPELLALLPGVTARWIAWVQRNERAVAQDLALVAELLDEALPQGSTNRSRLLRNYAVQVATLRAFLAFLRDETGVDAWEDLEPRAFEVHVAMGSRQLARVGEESAANLFVETLRSLLQSGVLYLRPRSAGAGENPWGNPWGTNTAGTCVGTYDHEGTASIWPDMAVPLVNQHLTRGGGGRIEFSARAIQQQLEQDGLIDVARERTSSLRDDRQAKARAWRFRVELLGGEVRQQPWSTAPVDDR